FGVPGQVPAEAAGVAAVAPGQPAAEFARGRPEPADGQVGADRPAEAAQLVGGLHDAGQDQPLGAGGPVVGGGAEVAQEQVEVEPVVGGGGPEPAELVQVDDGVRRPGRGEQGARGFGGAGLARSDGAGDQQGLRGGAFRGGGGGHFGLLGAPVLGGGVFG